MPNAMIELARQPADRRLVADIGRPKPARRQPAQMIRRLDQHDALAHSLSLNRRDNSGRRSAVHDDVNRFRRMRRVPQQHGKRTMSQRLRPNTDLASSYRCESSAYLVGGLVAMHSPYYIRFKSRIPMDRSTWKPNNAPVTWAVHRGAHRRLAEASAQLGDSQVSYDHLAMQYLKQAIINHDNDEARVECGPGYRLARPLGNSYGPFRGSLQTKPLATTSRVLLRRSRRRASRRRPKKWSSASRPFPCRSRRWSAS